MLPLAEFKSSAGQIFVKPPPAAILRLSRIQAGIIAKPAGNLF